MNSSILEDVSPDAVGYLHLQTLQRQWMGSQLSSLEHVPCCARVLGIIHLLRFAALSCVLDFLLKLFWTWVAPKYSQGHPEVTSQCLGPPGVSLHFFSLGKRILFNYGKLECACSFPGPGLPESPMQEIKPIVKLYQTTSASFAFLAPAEVV